MTIDDDLAAARLILERIGISPEDLLDQDNRAKPRSLGELVSTVSGVVPRATRELYKPYWRKALAAWPDRHVDDVKPTDVTSLTSPHVAELLAVARRILTGVITDQMELLEDLRTPASTAPRQSRKSAG